MKNQVSVAVTGLAWMGSGIGSIETAMERLFREAEHEILITSYAISTRADVFLDWIEACLTRGILIRIAVNKLARQPADVLARLHELNKAYPHFHLYSFDGEEAQDLHAKAVVADRNFAVVGSSNLSRRGFLTNHELALVVQGHSAEEVAFALDKLFLSSVLAEFSP
jgi:phosphatidylserine/phosphatidylglycerophosphate/cardiolipin synthase-like enzyme